MTCLGYFVTGILGCFLFSYFGRSLLCTCICRGCYVGSLQSSASQMRTSTLTFNVSRFFFQSGQADLDWKELKKLWKAKVTRQKHFMQAALRQKKAWQIVFFCLSDWKDFIIRVFIRRADFLPPFCFSAPYESWQTLDGFKSL